MKRIIGIISVVLVLLTALSGCGMQGIGDNISAGTTSESVLQSDPLSAKHEDWSFALTFGTYGISSYDSASGRLVKTTDATNPDDYVTELFLGTEELTEICDMLLALDIESYPEVYDPINDPDSDDWMMSEPSRKLILTVNFGDMTKTVTCRNVAYTNSGFDEKSQAFLDVCAKIQEIVTSTDEWKALPDYEVLYE